MTGRHCYAAQQTPAERTRAERVMRRANARNRLAAASFAVVCAEHDAGSPVRAAASILRGHVRNERNAVAAFVGEGSLDAAEHAEGRAAAFAVALRAVMGDE